MIEIGGLAGTLLLLVPFAVLLLIVVVVALRHTSEPSETPEPGATLEPQSGPGEMLTAIGGGLEREAHDEPAADPAPRVSLREEIQAAEERKDAAALPALYLALAQDEIARDNSEEGADHLRSCIRWAAKARNPATEAEARLELAELARAADDLTTACEHWQIARALFHKLDRKEALAGTEDAMRRHGCPTDWVLTDF